MQSVDGERMVAMKGVGLAILTCLLGVTGCLLIGLKCVNSFSMELLLQLLSPCSAINCGVGGEEGKEGEEGQEW